MPVVCVQRPNRTTPRKFTPRDVARIAKYAERDGHGVITILAGVVIALGLGFLVCKASKAFQSLTSLFRIVREVSIVLASALVVRTVIQALLQSRFARIPLINRATAVILALLILIERVASAAADLAGSLETVDDVTGFLDDLCSAVGERGSDIADAVKDII